MEHVLHETLNSYNEYLKKLPEGCLKIAELFRQYQVQNALDNVSNFAEGAIWLLETANLLKQNDVNIVINLEQVDAFLDEIVQAIEVQDYNLVADLFEYEIVEFFKQTEAAKLAQ